MMDKRGEMQSHVLQAIFVALIFIGLLMAVSERVNARDVRQQVLEKQMVLLIDSAEAGMEFGIRKVNVKGLVDNVKVEKGRVFVAVDGLGYSDGYPYFSRHSVSVEEEEDKFVVVIK
ncbi:hypothetical protein HNV12_16955 [Methanococcoides sp. SA1]|nr:hypothetical protein [Methanococcoides sp. SA1]